MRSLVAVAVILACGCSARTIGDDGVSTTHAGGASETAIGSDSSGGPSTLSTTTEDPTGDGDGAPGDGDGVPGDGDGVPGDGDGVPGDGDAAPGDGDGDPEDCMEPRKLDLPPDFDGVPPVESCTLEHIEWSTLADYPDCSLCQVEDWCFFAAYLGCVTPPPDLTCAEICPGGDCLSDYWNSCDGAQPWMFAPEDLCGYFEIDGQCCSIGKFFSGCTE